MTPIFPLQPLTWPGFSVHRRPTYNSIIMQGKNLREVETYQQRSPLWEFELTYEILRDKTQNIVPVDTKLGDYVELQRIAQLYLSCAGQYGCFFFDDWTDNSREKQLLGYGDGIKTSFTLLRTIVGSGIEFTEAVGGANLDYPVTVYLNDVAISSLDYGISDDLTKLVFGTPPTCWTSVKITYHYYYLCRFITDEQEFEEFMYDRWKVSSLKFRSISDCAVDPLDPFNDPAPFCGTPPITEYTCLDNFQWFSFLPTTANSYGDYQRGLQSVDKFGNWYYWPWTSFTSNMQVYDPTGSLLQSYTTEDLADLVDAWFGHAVVSRIGGYWNPNIGFFARPIYGGEYIIATFAANAGFISPSYIARWWVLLEPHADGSLTCVGAVYNAGPTIIPPFSSESVLGIANQGFTSDPILMFTSYSFGGALNVILVLPPISDFLAGTYSGGSFPGLIRVTILNFSGAAAGWGSYLYFQTIGPFILPNSEGGTNLYCYFNRKYTQTAIGGASTVPPELKHVVGPAYPYGSMVKFNLGVLDFSALSSNHLSGVYYGKNITNYTIDNPSWQYSDRSVAIPFSDEYTYLSSGASGGQDSYTMYPAGIYLRPDGRFWIFFIMAGIDDSLNMANSLMYESIRLFEYDKTTETAVTQILQAVCISHTREQVGAGTIEKQWYDAFQTVLYTQDESTVTLFLRGMLYNVEFLTFNIP